MKMKTKVKQSVHPEWATIHRKPGTELRFLGGKYYLYAVSSKYDPVLKRAKKISGKLLGRISQEEGFVVSDKNRLRQKAEQSFKIDKLTTKEFGTQELVLQLAEKQVATLEKVFGEDARALFLFALFRLTEQTPIKNVPFYYEHSFLSEKWKDVSVSDKSISQLLRRVGSNREKIMEYQKHFVREQHSPPLRGWRMLTILVYPQLIEFSLDSPLFLELLIFLSDLVIFLVLTKRLGLAKKHRRLSNHF
jgi:hypothetical protein